MKKLIVFAGLATLGASCGLVVGGCGSDRAVSPQAGSSSGRSDYADLLPVIVVAKPVEGTRASSGVVVSGSANVFEANVTVKVLDEHDNVVGHAFTTASCGTGCRGTYSVPVTFKVGREQPGTIVVSDDDAAGTGTPPHQVRVPVVLVP